MGKDLIIANNGNAETRDIDLTARSVQHPEWDGALATPSELPIGVLQAGGETRVRVRDGAPGAAPPFEITLRWTDETGPRKATHTVAFELVTT